MAWAVWLYLGDKNIYLACVHDFMAQFKPEFADDEIDRRELSAVLWRGKWLIFSLCSVALMLAVIYQTQTGAAVIVLCGFFALFVGSYRWAVRRARWPAYRRSRKLKNSELMER